METGIPAQTAESLQRILGRYPQVEQAILYGSRAMGRHKTGSDIDLTLLGDQLDNSTVFKIAHELEESTIPYKVDISVLAQIENSPLRQHIERVGQVFYQRKPCA